MTLKEKILKAAEFVIGERISTVDELSAKEENARLRPLIERLAECAEALRYCYPSDVQLTEAELTALEELLK